MEALVPSAMRIDLQTSAWETLQAGCSSMPGARQATEPWFDLPFFQVPLDPELLREWAAAAPAQVSRARPHHGRRCLCRDAAACCRAGAYEAALAKVQFGSSPWWLA